MRISLLGALCMGIILFTSCEKKEEETNNENIKKYYEGDWQMENDQPGGDSTFVVSINANGEFSKTVDFNSIMGTLNGTVNNQGKVGGNIKVSGITAGNIDGQLTTSGTGTGSFYLVSGDTVSWTAVKL